MSEKEKMKLQSVDTKQLHRQMNASGDSQGWETQ